jgi:hypothetical protein
MRLLDFLELLWVAPLVRMMLKSKPTINLLQLRFISISPHTEDIV